MTRVKALAVLIAISTSILTSRATAEIVLDRLVVELQPGQAGKQDVVIWNDAPDRAFVEIKPSRMVDPGSVSQQRVNYPDPRELELLVSPKRLILDPGQQKFIRIADLGKDDSVERVYRVTVEPVVDESDPNEGLRLLVGYDMLVLVRPKVPTFQISAVRTGTKLVVRNMGNASVELLNIRQCVTKSECNESPGGRIYVGIERAFDVALDSSAELSFSTALGEKSVFVE